MRLIIGYFKKEIEDLVKTKVHEVMKLYVKVMSCLFNFQSLKRILFKKEKKILFFIDKNRCSHLLKQMISQILKQ